MQEICATFIYVLALLLTYFNFFAARNCLNPSLPPTTEIIVHILFIDFIQVSKRSGAFILWVLFMFMNFISLFYASVSGIYL